MFAFMVGVTGAVLSSWIGVSKFGYSLGEALLWVGAVNLVGLVSSLTTLAMERVTRLKTSLLAGGLRTWTVLLILYIGGQLLLIPPMRHLLFFAAMVIPLLMSTGLMIQPIFGPIQDRLIRRSQRKAMVRSRRARTSNGELPITSLGMFG